MRFVLSFAVACLALGFAAAPRASAQYPVYAPPSYGHVVHDHSHSHHHYRPLTTQYYSGYGAPVYQYAPRPSYSPVYGSGVVYAQPAAPPSPIYYSNSTYYNVPPAHTHHRWHPGHYLLGHH